MKQKCDDLKNEKGIAAEFDENKRDVTVICWTDMFINEYLAPKLVKAALAGAPTPAFGMWLGGPGQYPKTLKDKEGVMKTFAD
jgi:hypothetical protein